MAERIKTFLIVSALAVVVWLFAEAESLGDAEVSARIEFPPVNSTSLLIRSEPRNPTVRLGLRGGKAALQRATSVLEAPIRLEPGRGIPDTDGRHVIDLADALRRSLALAETRVTIEFVRPPTLEVTIESLETVTLDILPDLPDVQTEGPIAMTPAKAEVRVPRPLAETLEEGTIVRARPAPDQAAGLLAPGPHSVVVPVQLPPALQGQLGVTLMTERTRLEFTVVSTLMTETFPSVPVQALLAPTEANEWSIDVEPQDQILSVDLTAPRAVMSELKSGSRVSLVAVLTLSDIDLQSGVTSKPVSFVLLRDGVLQPLPRDVAIRADRAEVRFKAVRIAPP